MAYELTGRVTFVGETETFNSGFQKRLFCIECQDGSYTNEYGFELMKDKVSKVDGVNIGDEVEVKFNLGTQREYNGRRYSNFPTAWYVKTLSRSPDAVPPAPDAGADVPTDDEDIPF